VPQEEAEGPHLKIGAVADLLGIRPHVLRYWEAEFRELRPKKTRGAHRMYGPREVQIARTIHRLIYAEGYTVAGAKKRLGEVLREGRTDVPKLVALDSRRPEPRAEIRPEPRPPRPEGPVISSAEGRAMAMRAELLALRAELTRLLAGLDALAHEAPPQHHAVVEAVVPSARRVDPRAPRHRP
jgi:DNA-binding transcriptional MerR regulator